MDKLQRKFFLCQEEEFNVTIFILLLATLPAVLEVIDLLAYSYVIIDTRPLFNWFAQCKVIERRNNSSFIQLMVY